MRELKRVWCSVHVIFNKFSFTFFSTPGLFPINLHADRNRKRESEKEVCNTLVHKNARLFKCINAISRIAIDLMWYLFWFCDGMRVYLRVCKLGLCVSILFLFFHIFRTHFKKDISKRWNWNGSIRYSLCFGK